jgi:PEP-CTERM motif
MKPIILAATAIAIMAAATSASATVEKITRSGSIFAPVTNAIVNPNGITQAGGVAVGDKITETITFDSSEVGRLTAGPAADPDPLLADPNFTGVALGNGDPANSLTLTVGPDTVTLADFVCAGDTSANGSPCAAANGLDFRLGPTAIFYKGSFIGVDSLFGIGGSPFTHDNVGDFVKSYLTDPTDAVAFFGTSRPDLFLVQDAGLIDVVFEGSFDGPAVVIPGYAAVPEPASWALMIFGSGLTGIAMRRRARKPVAEASFTIAQSRREPGEADELDVKF